MEDRSVSYSETPVAPFRGSSVAGFSSRERDWKRENANFSEIGRGGYGAGDRTPGQFESGMTGSRWDGVGGPFRGRGSYSEGRGAARIVTLSDSRGRGAGGRGKLRGIR